MSAREQPIVGGEGNTNSRDAIRARLFLFAVFLSMIAGMLGKTYYDHLTRHTTDFGFSQFVIPVIVSPMIFGVVFSFIKNTEAVPALILGFQNGFFWQDIFSGLKVP
jgi:hypothetical protein